ncbi:MAG TPA: FAD-binding protein [Propionibacteriaceae bacterium]
MLEHSRGRSQSGLVTVGPDDVRYGDLAGRGSRRFAGKPDYVQLVSSTEDVVEAVQDAVGRHLRVAVRSGGHCLEAFVSDPEVRVVIDTSLMSSVYFDSKMGAFAVEAGTRLGEAYRRLFLGWQLTIPAGVSPNVGIGGHVVGGGFGFLCRQHGLASDHLYAVEVVVVDDTGTVSSVVATREPGDPNRDLWWAHTGGGGGNFGVVTKYWFRSPGADGPGPAGLLPKAPDSVLTFTAEWNWEDLDQAGFTRLVRNYGDWCEQNSGWGAPSTELYSTLAVGRRQHGTIDVTGLTTGRMHADRLLDEHLAAITDGVGAPYTQVRKTKSWLEHALDPAPGLAGVNLEHATFKLKDALLRKRFTDQQIEVAYHHLTRTDHDVGLTWGMATYGGKVNTVAPEATASAHRDSILTTSVTAGWEDPVDEDVTMMWVRRFYRDLFAGTGGVPLPADVSSGASINHADIDLADPAWNTSGVPWHTIYYRENYARLQRVKARWDPLDIFRHALSIRPA